MCWYIGGADNTGNGNIYRGSIYRSREYVQCIGTGI
nr:MAG TPA: hypothetical protein [Caudoviricetes sp.]